MRNMKILLKSKIISILLLLSISISCSQQGNHDGRGVGQRQRLSNILNWKKLFGNKEKLKLEKVKSSSSGSNVVNIYQRGGGIFNSVMASAEEIIDGENKSKIVYFIMSSMIIACVTLLLINNSFATRCKEDLEEEEVSASDKEMYEIGFEEIKMTLSDTKNKKDRLILDGSIKGNAKPGRMLAIMGPSGGGKTSLLHALAGRVKYSKKLHLSGRRYVNGVALSEDATVPSAFIEQESNFFPHMTVKETLDFRVELKLGRKLSKVEREKLVVDLMDQLGLTKSANTIVGDKKVRGISGGERKRLSIACEMIVEPSVVFLDEPTSGLDSYQATMVVQTMRTLANQGKTIVAVIHQPSQHVFAMFDDLLLVSEGRQMYFDDVKRARSYFQSIGYNCENEMGTAEHIIDCISPSTTAIDNGDYITSQQRLDTIATRAINQANQIVISKALLENKTTKQQQQSKNNKFMKLLTRLPDSGAKGPAAGIIRQFKLLIKRSINEIVRAKGTIIIKIVQQVTVSIIYGGIYKLGTNQASIMDRFGLLSLIVIGTVNMGVAGTIRKFPKEKAIVSDELANHLYATLPYFLSKAISEVPLISFLSVIFGTILYPLVGLQKGKLQQFLGLVTLNAITAESAGLFVGAISPSSDFALALLPPIIVLNIIFDGKNISFQNTPKFLRWIPKLSLVKWAFETLSINEFVGLTFDAQPKGFVYKGPTVKTGVEALERFNIQDLSVRNGVIAQLNIIAGCWFMSYLGLSLTKTKFLLMNVPSSSNSTS